MSLENLDATPHLADRLWATDGRLERKPGVLPEGPPPAAAFTQRAYRV